MTKYVLALDQGTTSSRAIVFDRSGSVVGLAQEEFRQILPAPGSVEHDPEDIWRTQLATAKAALRSAAISATDLAAIGVANQRETAVVWERDSGRPVHNAIVWQSRVTAPICEALIQQGHQETIKEKTGLLVDAYFSGTKIKHILDQDTGLRARAERGEVLFGTVDCYLIWRLTGGRCHVTDVSNASRTMIFNIHTLEWDDELLSLLDIPRAMLPRVASSSEVYDHSEESLLGASIPIAGCAGDQQAATFGQACFEAGSAKNTYGTGCFMLLNTGEQAKRSENNLLTTIGWQIDGRTTYCLEGSVFVAGAIVQWLRDGLGIIEHSSDVESLADSVSSSEGVVIVPALVGLGAPHWDPYARGAIFGITRGTTAAHIAHAAVDSMAYQTCDVLDAMQQDAGLQLRSLKVDGGAAVNNRLMQLQADLLGVPVQRPVVAETTALGAAYLAGLAVGYWNGLADVTSNWALEREFQPDLQRADCDSRMAAWQKAVARAKAWEDPS